MALNNIIFAGIYSDNYQKIYDSIKRDLTKIIPTENIQFKKIDQSVFNQKFKFPEGRRCHWCRKNPCGFCFHQGETCKIEHHIELLEKYKDTDTVILYMDCDVKINFDKLQNNLEGILQRLDKVDILYQREGNGPSRRWKSGINIGLTISKSSSQVLKFYVDVLEYMKNNKYPAIWDQQVVNNLFHWSKTSLTFGLVGNHILFSHLRRFKPK